MIPIEVLERDRVLLQARRTADQIDRELATGTTTFTSNGEEVSAAEAIGVRNELRAAIRSERLEGVTGTHSADVYLPRNRVLSNLQSLVTNRVTVGAPQRLQEAVAAGGGDESSSDDYVDHTGTDSFGASSSGDSVGDVSTITTYSVADKLDDALQPIRPAEAAYVPYSDNDPFWLVVGLALAEREINDLLNGQRKFNNIAAQHLLGESSRLFLFGDWGSGICRARKLAAAITRKLHEDESRGRDCHVIHLGDTYFAGFPEEQQEHVLNIWPATDESWSTSWALPGNHDYYSGGVGFYNTLLADRRFTHQSSPDGTPTSIFEIANQRWLTLGLDSGFVDHDLVPEEQVWLKEQLDAAASRGQRVILLSHHQPWSVFTAGPHPPLWQRAQQWWAWLKALFTGKSEKPMLWSRVQPLLANRQLEAWFWGHEHRLALYKETTEIKRPRLLGNAGVPSKVTDSSYVNDESRLLFDYEVALGSTAKLKPWCRFAFAVVDLDADGTFTESYYDEDGQLIVMPRAPS